MGPHTAGDVGPDQIDGKKPMWGPTPARRKRCRSTLCKAPSLKVRRRDGEVASAKSWPRDRRSVDKWQGICRLGIKPSDCQTNQTAHCVKPPIVSLSSSISRAKLTELLIKTQDQPPQLKSPRPHNRIYSLDWQRWPTWAPQSSKQK